MKLNRRHIRKLILAEMYAMSGQDMRDSGRLREDVASKLYNILSALRMDEADLSMFASALESSLARAHFDVKGEDQDYQVTIAPASQLARDFSAAGMLRENQTTAGAAWKIQNTHEEYGTGAQAILPVGGIARVAQHPAWKQEIPIDWWHFSGAPGSYRVEFHDSKGAYRTLTPSNKGLIDPFAASPGSYDNDDLTLLWEEAVVVNLSDKPVAVFAGGFNYGP